MHVGYVIWRVLTKNDVISAKESPRAKTVLKGRLESNGKKAVIIRADEDNSEDTVCLTWIWLDVVYK